ncbi:hypothetical protein [Marinobacterium aestuariivivens]|uniref:Uncharacterized protein n=1 Tax=Marinobacterium aestuariivivens TaxID=1698799 RepID=A0ABW1ZZA8_9GAMM
MQTLIPVATLSLIDRGNQGVDSNGATRIRDGIVTGSRARIAAANPPLR